MDPVEDGAEILHNIASRWPEQQILDPSHAEELFRALIDDADGCVNVDFLDRGNWDCIEGFDFDPETATLLVHWHDYREQDLRGPSVRSEISRMVFPASLYSFAMHLQEIRILRGEDLAVFLLKGYALSDKQSEKLLDGRSTEEKWEDNRFFSRRAIRRVGGLWNLVDVHTAPFYTVAILPKNLAAPSTASRAVLFEVTIQEALDTLMRTLEALETASDRDTTTICEKANTARRTLEFLVKTELCFHDVDRPKSYSHLLLGDLAKQIKPYIDDKLHKVLKTLTVLANEFSHDTGRPVERSKAQALATMTMLWGELLKSKTGRGITPRVR